MSVLQDAPVNSSTADLVWVSKSTRGPSTQHLVSEIRLSLEHSNILVSVYIYVGLVG